MSSILRSPTFAFYIVLPYLEPYSATIIKPLIYVQYIKEPYVCILYRFTLSRTLLCYHNQTIKVHQIKAPYICVSCLYLIEYVTLLP